MAEETVEAPTRRGRKKVTPVETDTKVGLDPALKVRPGDTVFLTYLAGPDVQVGSELVTHTNREAVVPDDISPEDLLKIDRHVRLGNLTVGSLPEEAKITRYLTKDPSVLEYCKRMLEHPAETRELCSGLTRAGSHLSGWAPKDLIKELIKHENQNLSRRQILDLLHTALNSARLISFRSVPFDPQKHATSDVHYKIDAIRTRP